MEAADMGNGEMPPPLPTCAQCGKAIEADAKRVIMGEGMVLCWTCGREILRTAEAEAERGDY